MPWAGLIWVHGGGWIGGDKAPLPPILAVYPFLQRYVTTGVKLGAIKG